MSQYPQHPQFQIQPPHQADSHTIQAEIENLLQSAMQTHRQLSGIPNAQQEVIAFRYLYPQFIQALQQLGAFVRDYNSPVEDGEDGEDGESALAYRNLVELVQRVVLNVPLPIPALSALLLGLRPCLEDLHGMDDAQFERHFAAQLTAIQEANTALIQHAKTSNNGI